MGSYGNKLLAFEQAEIYGEEGDVRGRGGWRGGGVFGLYERRLATREGIQLLYVIELILSECLKLNGLSVS